jgi:hypothetical protein
MYKFIYRINKYKNKLNFLVCILPMTDLRCLHLELHTQQYDVNVKHTHKTGNNGIRKHQSMNLAIVSKGVA